MVNIFKLFIIMILSVLLSACPEAGSDIRTYCRADTLDPNTVDGNGDPVKIGDILRTYVPFDGIQYAVSGVRNGTPVSGTLTVDWGDDGNYTFLPVPIISTGVKITALEEKTSSDLFGINGTTRRYIVQEPNGTATGSLSLWAFGDASGPQQPYYWTNTADGNLASVTKVLLFDSPINSTTWTADKQITHFPMLGCAPSKTSCDSNFAEFSETNTLLKSTIVETIRGTFFEAYEIQINNGNILNRAINGLPTPLDFRHMCRASVNDNSPINFNGKMWMFPEVGVIKYQINCTSGTGLYNLTFDFLNSNIPLPAGVSGDQNTACN